MMENYKYCTKFGNLEPFFDNLLPYLPYQSQFLKCCHFLVIYHSESCKSLNNRESFEINESWLKKLNFIDFLLLFLFDRFFPRLCS